MGEARTGRSGVGGDGKRRGDQAEVCERRMMHVLDGVAAELRRIIGEEGRGIDACLAQPSMGGGNTHPDGRRHADIIKYQIDVSVVIL
jgi:hypothetical protein